MGLRPTHLGYAYQDLLTAIRLVDVALGRAARVIVDSKMFDGDRFDDVTCEWRAGGRDRLQIKHTATDRELATGSFTGDRRGLSLDLLVTAVDQDLQQHPRTCYRIVLRDTEPHDPDLVAVLGPVDASTDPGPALHGLSSTRFRFDADALMATDPWRSMLVGVGDDAVHRACDLLVVDVGVPGCSLDIRNPGAAEQVLLRRVTDELGAGRPPNRHRTPEDVALALIEAAKAARSLDGTVTARDLVPRLDLAVDFGAVREGHPVDRAVEIARPLVLDTMAAAVGEAVEREAAVVVTGGPGIGKSWLCEQLADRLRGEEWIVARHHCWLCAADVHRDRRVLAEVVIGSLLGQLEAAAPETVAQVRPRYAATVETLTAAVAGIRRDRPDRRIALIIDGLDHVTRVRGRVDGAAFHTAVDSARALVDELAALDLPAGVTLLLASQPGGHLAPVDGAAGAAAVTVPPLDRHEIRGLAQRLGVLAAVGPAAAGPGSDDRADDAVDLIHARSRGNTLYATYLCRQAVGRDPVLGDPGLQHADVADPLDRLRDVPASVHELNEYYAYLLAGLTEGQHMAVGLLAVCEFAVTADELREIFPAVAPILAAALTTVAPIVAHQPGIGGLKIHHESFSRFVRSQTDEAWIAHIRADAAEWLERRGFFTDARAFRHLPELLADLDRDDDLAALIGPDFLSRAIAGLQPPAAIAHTLTVAARRSAARCNWPTLVRCVELRRATDTYESDGIPDTIVAYADVLVALFGAEAIAATLLYDGAPTVPARWGLQLCAAVDTAGAPAPWDAYLTAWDETRDSNNVHYGQDSDNDVFLAKLRGRLRLSDRGPHQTGDDGGDDSAGATTAERVAAFLAQDGLPAFPRVLDVLLDGLGPAPLVDAVPLIDNSEIRAELLLHLADASAVAGRGLPSPRTLADDAWTCSGAVEPRRLLRHGVPVADLADRILGADVDATLRAATDDLLRDPNPDLPGAVRRWLTLLAVAHEQDPHAPTRLLPHLEGAGFFREWLRFTVATVGLHRDMDAGALTSHAASGAVRVALDHLAQAAQPFTGTPRVCDLGAIHAQVHEVLHEAVALLAGADLEPALASLNAISDGTTTSLMGMAGAGPLITTDLLAMLSRTVDQTGAAVVHRLMHRLRDEHANRRGLYPESADFELEMARVSLAAGDPAEARRCWNRAARYMAAYGSHKDSTIHELLDPLPNLAAADPDQARTRLARVQPLAYLVAQRTDGRSTSATPHDWWRRLADLDPHAAADLAADVLLAEPGLPDGLVDAAHLQLLAVQATADPVVLAALRVTAGPGGRHLDRDVALLDRLAALAPDDPAHAAGVLPLLANALSATYDDQPLIYASDADGPEPTTVLRDAAHRLGGDGPPPRTPKPDSNSSSERRARAPADIATFLHAQQRPALPPGAVGAVAAVRDHGSKPYNDDPDAPRWSAEALTNAIGWRLMQVAADNGADAAAQLLYRVADEFGALGATALLADVGAGLELRRDTDPGTFDRLASVAHTLAFAKIRGGGGRLTFAGRDRLDLWQRAQALDAAAAAATLADQVASAVAGRRYGTIGVTQALVAAFAARPPDPTRPAPADALACWDAAFAVIAHRLPGTADIGPGTYEPTTGPVVQCNIDIALSRLALATLAMPERADRRRTLVAATVMLAARPAEAQAAAARVLAADLGAGPLTWLLRVLSDGLRDAPLADDLAAQLVTLARSDLLSVRVEAANVLAAAGLPVPDPPATLAHPALACAIAAEDLP